MSRAARLLDLIQALRRRRRPVTAARLAEELGVSERTIYRDVATLIAQGASIEGEAGLGYVLKPGFLLPPLMFGDDEIESLVLGLRWVMEQGDRPLAAAAEDALAKIGSVLPEGIRDKLGDAGLLAGPGEPKAADLVDLSELRRAIRCERKLRIFYADGEGRRTERMIWPIALAFFERVRVVAAWCELRQGFRHFRTDRISAATASALRYPRRRQALMKEWRALQGILSE
ncbi:MAG: YafY family transcriptional regulator [Proteobacteria bacterium]|nr:YafY family transcriptional regulator [Pseudomonadota bacterium]MBI3495897.1 YafY family transcriptional regulator [Pseudomonadota bacterium]